MSRHFSELTEQLKTDHSIVIDEALAQEISRTSGVRELEIGRAHFLSRKAFETVVTKADLESLRMTWLQIVEMSAATREAWKAYPDVNMNLVLRGIDSNPQAGENITNSAFTAIKAAKSLRVLRLHRADALGDAAGKAIAELSGLRELELEDTDITDEGLAALGALPGLEWVSVGLSLKLGGAGFAAWNHIEKLRGLDLRCCPIEDAGLAEVIRFRNIETLHLNQCARLTWPAIRTLADLPRLRDVWLLTDTHNRTGCHVSFEDLHEFVEACPSLRYINNYPSSLSEEECFEIDAILYRRPRTPKSN